MKVLQLISVYGPILFSLLSQIKSQLLQKVIICPKVIISDKTINMCGKFILAHRKQEWEHFYNHGLRM